MFAEAIKTVRAVRHRQNLARLATRFSEAASSISGSVAYADLHPLSLAASSVVETRSAQRHVTIIVPEAHVDRIFAGIRTALQYGAGLADRLDLPLRIVTLWNTPTGRPAADAISYVDREFRRSGTASTSIISIEQLAKLKVSSDDIWIGTHWTTAHPLDIASRIGVIRKEQIVYLVQDYEPGFYAWSSDFALARATYHAGFHLVVNSSPLRDYLRLTERVDVDDALVFAPSLDLDRLRRAAEERRRSSSARIMFYGRPSRPRNLFDIGLAALRIAASRLESNGIAATFVSAGEQHRQYDLAPGTALKAVGKVPWDSYFELISQTDVMLSLQHSPHPSHPPLDAIASGGMAVTNEMGGTRTGLHPRLRAVEPDPVALADAVFLAAEEATKRDTHPFDPAFLEGLGGSIEGVVEASASSIEALT